MKNLLALLLLLSFSCFAETYRGDYSVLEVDNPILFHCAPSADNPEKMMCTTNDGVYSHTAVASSVLGIFNYSDKSDDAPQIIIEKPVWKGQKVPLTFAYINDGFTKCEGNCLRLLDGVNTLRFIIYLDGKHITTDDVDINVVVAN